MKIQCNVCEATEANVLCCADEAALCWACDDKVHAANKLASKHQRVPLTTASTQLPKCDICQEASGFFFCLEDRALLCRKCDLSIHTANPYMSAHQRFLLTGVKVAPESTDPGQSAVSMGKSTSEEKISKTKICHAARNTASVPKDCEHREVLPLQASGARNMDSTEVSFGGGSSTGGGMSQWHIDDFLALTDYNHNSGYMDNCSSKAESGRLGDSDSSSLLRSGEEEMGEDECIGQVPETSWYVPQISSPPTASGLYWPIGPQNQRDSAGFVPDINIFTMQRSLYFQSDGTVSKRRRPF